MGLREFRKGRGLTLEAVAYLAQTDHSAVSRWERGLTRPGPHATVRLARALGISVARLERLLDEARDGAATTG